jgi:excisionase family DNA binding protein
VSNLPAMRTYTTQQAAELTGTSVRALRKRIERGQLRAVQHGRYWKIPHPELVRLGMIAPEGTSRGQVTEGTAGPDAVLAALERERAERERLTQELARLRPLPAQIERITEDLHRERAERLAAEAKAGEAMSVAEELRAAERALAAAGFFERRRMLRELRHPTA